MKCKSVLFTVLLALLVCAWPATSLMAQVDQGTITGIVQDPSGAVIPNASVTLTNTDQGFVLNGRTDHAGVYVFSPIKIGNYSLTAAAPGFSKTTQTNLQLNLQQTLNVIVSLKPGASTETVTVTSQAPLMQTQESSVGQTMDTHTIDSVPLNGRNWVYIAQLAPGAAPPSGSRGQDKGDFNANGQRAEENNFILDGVDNNANVVDFYNGASFVAQPPPDALAEFKLQTSDYSAEFGHSAGAVINASIKSGTNTFHGNLWEYVRNTAFDTYDWDNYALAQAGNPVPAYHENQFGATLGGPFLKNRLFFFADVQANRVVFNETGTYSVPSLLERAGDFSEINTNGVGVTDSLTGDPGVQLYHQTANAAPVAFANNCLVTSSYCTSSVAGVTLNPTAVAVLNDYPKPNANGTSLVNNFVGIRSVVDNTFQWDARMDWTITSKDSSYSRYSYWNEVGYHQPPLGNILDGGGFGDDGKQKIYGANYMWSETHVFNPTFTNEARFGFNYLHTGFQQPNAANLNFAASVGFGGIPVAPLNGGLPNVGWSGNDTNTLTNFGSPTWATTDEHNNIFQILDNVTKVAGNHTLKAGVSFENIRFSTLQPQQSRGSYTYSGTYTSNLSATNTGFGLADLLLDMQHQAGLSNEVTNGDQRSDNAVYFEDDWRVKRNLTLNLGLRWELFQPYQDVGGYQASYNLTSKPTLNTTTGYGSASAQYLIPSEAKAYAAPVIAQFGYDQVLAKDNVSIVYTSNPRLLSEQHTNFAPRIGLDWSPDSKTVVRTGFGIFYGGLESIGYWPNLGENYPFQFTGSFYSPSCGTYNCGTDGITIANGFSTIIANGFASNVEDLTARGSDPTVKTPYTEDWNLSIERGLTSNISATVSYVGNTSRHLQVLDDPNSSLALENNANSIQNARPLPDFGGSSYTTYSGMSDYHSLQAKLEKRMSNGLNFLTSYTWGHALDDAPTPLGSSDDSGVRNPNLIPIKMDYSQSGFDTRQRFTFNALYELPFGRGRAYLNNSRLLDELVGGWSDNAQFVAQTGNYFTVGTSGIATAQGFENGPFAYQIRNEYASGGSGSNCAAKVKTRQNWYNPCSYANPWDSNDPVNQPSHYIPKSATDPQTPAGDTTPVYVTDLTRVLGYAGGKRDNASGPGYERVNMSVFKSFPTYHEQSLTFRADVFNLFNTPSLNLPSTRDTSSGGGTINSPRNIQQYSPDSRFFQLSLKYAF